MTISKEPVFDALDNLVHDNYERSFSGSKNRDADAGLVRSTIEQQAARIAELEESLRRSLDAECDTPEGINTLAHCREVLGRGAGEGSEYDRGWNDHGAVMGQVAEPFAYCFTDVNGNPQDFCDAPEHASEQDLRVRTPLYLHPVPARQPQILDDDSLARQIGEIGNQVHNLGCDHQNDEDLSERLATLACALWGLAQRSPKQAQKPAVPSPDAARELISGVRSVNRGQHHLVQVEGDDEPCYYQRGEWIEWILELADLAEQSIAQQPAVPEGWKLVPVEPTREMLIDGAKAARDFLSENGQYPRAHAVYRAMLAAAPQPDGEGE